MYMFYVMIIWLFMLSKFPYMTMLVSLFLNFYDVIMCVF